MSVNVLSCKCGDCLHWEVMDDDGCEYLKCKTCEVVYPVTIEVPKHDQLEWVERDEA